MGCITGKLIDVAKIKGGELVEAVGSAVWCSQSWREAVSSSAPPPLPDSHSYSHLHTPRLYTSRCVCSSHLPQPLRLSAVVNPSFIKWGQRRQCRRFAATGVERRRQQIHDQVVLRPTVLNHPARGFVGTSLGILMVYFVRSIIFVSPLSSSDLHRHHCPPRSSSNSMAGCASVRRHAGLCRAACSFPVSAMRSVNYRDAVCAVPAAQLQ
jgi:hypothetical protein